MRGKKTGGRVSGTPNKRTAEAIEVFEAHEFCPLEKTLKHLQSPGISSELYLSTCLKLMEFKFPRRKAVELSHDLKDVATEDLILEAKELIQKLGNGD